MKIYWGIDSRLIYEKGWCFVCWQNPRLTWALNAQQIEMSLSHLLLIFLEVAQSGRSWNITIEESVDSNMSEILVVPNLLILWIFFLYKRKFMDKIQQFATKDGLHL